MNFFRLSVTLQNKRIDKNPVFFMEYGIFLFFNKLDWYCRKRKNLIWN